MYNIHEYILRRMLFNSSLEIHLIFIHKTKVNINDEGNKYIIRVPSNICSTTCALTIIYHDNIYIIFHPFLLRI